jgi:hypothetical protein
MKTLKFVIVFLSSVLSLSTQAQVEKWVGDTLGPWATITFEEASEYISIQASAQNLWQIGKPQKTMFNEAYTIPNAMVTDTLNFYPVNNQSAFDLYIGAFNTSWNYYDDLFIDLRHKFDTDTLLDGGFITASWDHGQSWMNIIDDTISQQFYFASPAQNWGMWGNNNLYTSENTLFNGEHGFSGKSNGWVHSCMAWYNLPVKHGDFFPPDTMIIRFNFVSDNIQNNKEGWMIDQIRIYSIDLGSDIRENLSTASRIQVVPNPLKTSATISLGLLYDQVAYQLVDPSGRILQQGNPGKCSEFQIHRGNLSPGIYLLTISDGEGQQFPAKKIMVQ